MSSNDASDKWENFTFPSELNNPYVNPCDIMEPLFHEFIRECIKAIDESEAESLSFKFAYIPPKSQDEYKGPFRYQTYKRNYVDNIIQFLEFTLMLKFNDENKKKYKPMLLCACDGSYTVDLVLLKPLN